MIATRWGGPADYIDQTCGILVDPSSEQAMIASFAQAMQLLVDQPDLAAAMGKAGRVRVLEQFNWLRKIDQIEEIYREAIQRTA